VPDDRQRQVCLPYEHTAPYWLHRHAPLGWLAGQTMQFQLFETWPPQRHDVDELLYRQIAPPVTQAENGGCVAGQSLQCQVPP